MKQIASRFYYTSSADYKTRLYLDERMCPLSPLNFFRLTNLW